ncbi:malate dehydrogenase [Myroides sp. M-43]|uniref:malate dehydrogenase n=1 Tax=Myroides oncorhynchi TaxID=2893756 RepID=UPI001E404764|nr:malate dehydrogenase [Myroides oncorhynchi]MCC9043339.1 malate dehydrogenase [Myroides oncorhynchi]
MKVTIVGAGNVGATCAEVIANRRIASEVVLVDIANGYAEGKAMDIMQCASNSSFDTIVKGSTDDYSLTTNSDVVVITSGIPRKPGMTREELIGTNATVVKTVIEKALKHSPEAIFIIVTNPLDTMTLAALKITGLDRKRIIGMGGALDSARFKYFLSEKLDKPVYDIEGIVIGGHGDTTMIPLIRYATYKGIPVSELLSLEQQEEVCKSTMVGGATLTKLLGTSAWYAPGAAVANVVESILNDFKRMIPCSVFLEGEYGQTGLCIGVPCIIGKNGVEEIVELELSDKEQELFLASANVVRDTNKELTNI